MGDGREGGSGSTVYDESPGRANDGTVENGPVFSGETV